MNILVVGNENGRLDSFEKTFKAIILHNYGKVDKTMYIFSSDIIFNDNDEFAKKFTFLQKQIRSRGFDYVIYNMRKI